MKSVNKHSLVLATQNQNKIREFQEILGVKVQGLDLDLEEIQEVDPVKVAGEKAREAYRVAKEPVLVEDTSLAIDAWGGLPGPLIKWFLKTVGNEGIIKMMEGEKNRKAIAKTVIAFFDGQSVYSFLGELEGTIPVQFKGDSGFGWDPIFTPKGHTKTFAEMGSEEKNADSMRRKAIEKLKLFLEK